MPDLKRLIFTCTFLLAGCTVSPEKADITQLIQQVEETERAFARTMADRDLDAFKWFLSEEAVFFSGGTTLHGKKQIVSAWNPYFEGPIAPFSWEPKRVVVLDSGTLALSTGPVHDPKGKLVGTFTSIWQLDASGNWRVIFDKGNEVCD